MSQIFCLFFGTYFIIYLKSKNISEALEASKSQDSFSSIRCSLILEFAFFFIFFETWKNI